MRTDVAVIILARGGSKGVQRKNLQLVGGMSLLTRAIRTCREVRCRSRASRGNREVQPEVFVSTDDDQIAATATAEGAHVIWRPAELAGDDAQGYDALRHAAAEIDCDIIAMVQCTAPMMTSRDIRRTIHALECGYDMTVATVPFDGVVLDSKGKMLTFEIDGPENRQQRELMQQFAGSVWAFHPSYLKGGWYHGVIGCVPSEYPKHCEIDTEEDLDVARLVISGQQSERAESVRNRPYAPSERGFSHL